MDFSVEGGPDAPPSRTPNASHPVPTNPSKAKDPTPARIAFRHVRRLATPPRAVSEGGAKASSGGLAMIRQECRSGTGGRRSTQRGGFGHAVKELPHPHPPVAFGFWNVKPDPIMFVT